MALEDYFVPVCYVDRVTVPDGSGGVYETWKQGAEFRAGITLKSSTEALIAERNGMKAIYAVVTLPVIELRKDDRIMRIDTGDVLRVTSNGRDMTTPGVASLKMRQVTAEVVEA